MLLAGCGIRTRAELRWIGDVTPMADAASCPTTRGVLVMRENRVTFTPDEGTWVLTGTAGPDGTIEAAHSRRTSNRTTYETTLKARWTETELVGTYTTPRCKYKVSLQRR